jgi:hypothetical protein
MYRGLFREVQGWLSRKMDGKAERWVTDQRDGWLRRQMDG